MSVADGGGPEPPDPREPAPPRRGRGLWHVGTPVVVLLSGALLAVSATDSDGTDLRPGRYTDLASLVRSEAGAYEQLQDRVTGLSDEVDRLTDDVDDASVERLHRRVEELKDPAGLLARTGPGVTVTLSDAPEDVLQSAIADEDIDLNSLVVHQQDLQAVVNALWRGGAAAVTIAGQRVVTTTGIKCEGNAVQLQGVPYPQPYAIQAVGDPSALVAALDADEAVSGYRSDSADPEIAIGWDLRAEEEIEAPAYDGLLDLSYAEPIR